MRIVELIQNVIEADAAKLECFANCDASPGYHCWNETQAAIRASEDLESALGEFIKAKVREVLEERKEA